VRGRESKEGCLYISLYPRGTRVHGYKMAQVFVFAGKNRVPTWVRRRTKPGVLGTRGTSDRTDVECAWPEQVQRVARAGRGGSVTDDRIKTWMLELEGRLSVLQTWDTVFDAPEARVDRHQIGDEEPRYFLESSSFDGLRDVEIQTKAHELLTLMNAVAKIDYRGHQVALGRVPVMVFSDGTRERTKVVTVDFALPMEFVATVSTGAVHRPAMSSEQRWLQIAQRDGGVADALSHFVESDDWFAIYKTGEVIEDAVGGGKRGRKAVDGKGWLPKGSFANLMRTANHFRHSDRGRLSARYPLPPNPPSIDEARSSMRTVLRRWIEQR
jgi:hypothetical protein